MDVDEAEAGGGAHVGRAAVVLLADGVLVDEVGGHADAERRLRQRADDARDPVVPVKDLFEGNTSSFLNHVGKFSKML